MLGRQLCPLKDQYQGHSHVIWPVVFFLEGYHIPKAWFIGIFYALHNDPYLMSWDFA